VHLKTEKYSDIIEMKFELTKGKTTQVVPLKTSASQWFTTKGELAPTKFLDQVHPIFTGQSKKTK
jgi:hypothetical protein